MSRTSSQVRRNSSIWSQFMIWLGSKVASPLHSTVTSAQLKPLKCNRIFLSVASDLLPSLRISMVVPLKKPLTKILRRQKGSRFKLACKINATSLQIRTMHRVEGKRKITNSSGLVRWLICGRIFRICWGTSLRKSVKPWGTRTKSWSSSEPSSTKWLFKRMTWISSSLQRSSLSSRCDFYSIRST